MPTLLKPSEIVRRLSEHVVGQDDAKKTLAVAIYAHFRRMANIAEDSVELTKSNILLIGPTGTGKTLLCETLARILDVPFVTADATSLAQTQFVGDEIDRVRIRAATAAGLFYGGITFRQLLPARGFSTSAVAAVSLAVPEAPPGRVRRLPPGPGSWTVPCCEIADAPRFGWRGLLLDPARHFLPPEAIKRFIEAMALHKLNTLQLHLTDDQGWRLEIRKYPRLTQIGSVRQE